MPRRQRKESTQGLYHILQRGIDKRDLFYDENDFKRYLMCLTTLPESWNLTLLGYCLMFNHVHLLVQVSSLEALAGAMQMVGQDYARWHNFKYERTGHLFDNRYRSYPIEDIDHLVEALHYIHRNPISAMLVRRCEDYCWSSYREYLAYYRFKERQDNFKHDTNPATQDAIERSPKNETMSFEWICSLFPSARAFQRFMNEERLHGVSRDGTNIQEQLVKLNPSSDLEYYKRVHELYDALLPQAAVRAAVDYATVSWEKKRRLGANALERNWLICHIYKTYPTSPRQLGRVLGYSHNIVQRALNFEHLIPRL